MSSIFGISTLKFNSPGFGYKHNIYNFPPGKKFFTSYLSESKLIAWIWKEFKNKDIFQMSMYKWSIDTWTMLNTVIPGNSNQSYTEIPFHLRKKGWWPRREGTEGSLNYTFILIPIWQDCKLISSASMHVGLDVSPKGWKEGRPRGWTSPKPGKASWCIEQLQGSQRTQGEDQIWCWLGPQACGTSHSSQWKLQTQAGGLTCDRTIWP